MGLLTDVTRAVALMFPGGGGKTFFGWGSNDYISSTTPFRLPDERDYRTKVGDGSGTSLVTAIVNWAMREVIPARRVILEHPTDDAGVPRMIRRHPALTLLDRPNPYYDGTTMDMAVVASYLVDGNAYRFKVRSAMRRVVEYQWLPHWCIEPIGGGKFIDHYRYSFRGQSVELDPRDVDHLRFGLDPQNPRKGMSQFRGVLRELYTDEEAARFTAALMHNLGFPGAIVIAGKDVEIGPDAREEIVDKFDARFTADGRGKTTVLGANAEVKFLQWSPNELALGDLRDIPEERVSAVSGIPAAVVGFGTGLQQVKVGATMRELRSMAWESALLPYLELDARSLTRQLLPEFVGYDDRFEISWDLSRVAALSDIQLKRAQLEKELVGGGIKMVDEARLALGLPAVGGSEGGFKANPGVGGASAGGDRGDKNDDAEALDDESADLSLRELAVLEQVAQGHTNKAIADRLRTSERTVQRVISRAMEKTGTTSRAELVARAGRPLAGAAAGG